MPTQYGPPIGLALARAAKAASRAFDDTLAAAGGSLPVWLVLLSLKTQRLGNQRELAEAVGIQGATLTHHLNAMEANGLLTRRRDPANRRVHLVELTDLGEAMFVTLRTAAVGFDQRLRRDLTSDEVADTRRVLDVLTRNATRAASQLE
jgi:MarR family transcriptional regulator for hemolysin